LGRTYEVKRAGGLVDTSANVKLRAKTPGGNAEVCEFQVEGLERAYNFPVGARDLQSNSAALLGVFHSQSQAGFRVA